MKTALVVEDSGIIRIHFRKLLEEYCPGYDLFETGDGLKGLDMAIRLEPALLITDINLPNLDGPNLICHYHQNVPNNNSKIYLTSANTEALLNYASQLQGYINGIIQKGAGNLETQIKQLAEKEWRTRPMYW